MAKRGFGGGMMPGNMNNLLKQAQKMQENMQKMQAELEAKGNRSLLLVEELLL